MSADTNEAGFVTVSMTNAELQACAKPLAEAFNAAVAEGFSLDEVIATALVLCGQQVAKRGGVMSLDAPLRTALPPFVLGYEVARKRISS